MALPKQSTDFARELQSFEEFLEGFTSASIMILSPEGFKYLNSLKIKCIGEAAQNASYRMTLRGLGRLASCRTKLLEMLLRQYREIEDLGLWTLIEKGMAAEAVHAHTQPLKDRFEALTNLLELSSRRSYNDEVFQTLGAFIKECLRDVLYKLTPGHFDGFHSMANSFFDFLEFAGARREEKFFSGLRDIVNGIIMQQANHVSWLSSSKGPASISVAAITGRQHQQIGLSVATPETEKLKPGFEKTQKQYKSIKEEHKKIHQKTQKISKDTTHSNEKTKKLNDEIEEVNQRIKKIEQKMEQEIWKSKLDIVTLKCAKEDLLTLVGEEGKEATNLHIPQPAQPLVEELAKAKDNLVKANKDLERAKTDLEKAHANKDALVATITTLQAEKVQLAKDFVEASTALANLVANMHSIYCAHGHVACDRALTQVPHDGKSPPDNVADRSLDEPEELENALSDAGTGSSFVEVLTPTSSVTVGNESIAS